MLDLQLSHVARVNVVICSVYFQQCPDVACARRLKDPARVHRSAFSGNGFYGVIEVSFFNNYHVLVPHNSRECCAVLIGGSPVKFSPAFRVYTESAILCDSAYGLRFYLTFFSSL